MCNEYPTEEELYKISTWTADDFYGLLNYIKALWAYADCGYWQEKEDGLYYISTAGWSGNESIISAMRKNFVWWSLFWRQSQCGGHYIFATSSDWHKRNED